MQSRLPTLNLGPRYRLLEVIASGGMGTIHLALMNDGDSVHPVAIKVMHPHLSGDSEIVAMFLDEARIATRVQHRNVVQVTDVDFAAGDLVMVMEYVEGLSLSAIQRALRKRGEMLPVTMALRVILDVLSGLHAAHELCDESGAHLAVVHRDVSPHNVLVGTDGVARVSDFGVAQAQGRIASTRPDGTVKGKLAYLSPEQVYRRPVDRRADIFAAGIVLWECLTGERLFSAPTEGETLAMILREPIRPPSLRRPDISPELDEVCMRALERDPDRRFLTALEFAATLQRVSPAASWEDVGAFVERLGEDEFERRRAALEPTVSVRKSTIGLSQARSPSLPPSSTPRRRMLLVPAVVVAGLLLAGGTWWAAKRGTVPVGTGDPRPGASASATSSAEEMAAVPVMERPLPTIASSTTALDPRGASSSRSPKGERTSMPGARPPARTPASRVKPAASRPFMPDDL